MVKKTAAILCAGLLLAGSALPAGAQVTVDDAASVVTLRGKVDSGRAGVRIGIDVFAPGMDYEALRSTPMAEFKRVLALRDQTVSGEDGSWEVRFEIWDDPALDYDAQSGTYTAVIFPEDAEQSYRETFSYLNLAGARTAIAQIMEGTQEDIAGLLRSNPANLGIDYPFFDDALVGATARLIYAAAAAGQLSGADAMADIDVLRAAAVIAAADAGRLDNVFAYGEALGLARTELGGYAEKYYVSQNASGITQALRGGNYADFADFLDALENHTVLEVVKNPDGIGNIREILRLFSGRDGWNTSYSDAALRAVQGRSYQSPEALKEALNAASGSTGGGSAGGSGGGGGYRGSGSGGGTRPGVTVESGGVTPPQPMEYNIFTDLGDVSWARDAILYLTQTGVVNGKTDSLFCPNDTITREELAKLLTEAFAPEAEAVQIAFTDAPEGAWYTPYLAKAAGAGIITGYEDGSFGVGREITRQDMCTMVYRAAQYSGIALEGARLEFTDQTEIADYAREAVGALCANDVVIGVELGRFAPLDTATRAEAAKVVYKLLMM